MNAVIITVYNQWHLIHELSNSLLKVDLLDKIIIVDDGSDKFDEQTAKELTILSEKIDIVRKPNGGVSSARNAGIEYLSGFSGKLIFIDADDGIHPDNLNKAIYLSNSNELAIYSARKIDKKSGRAVGLIPPGVGERSVSNDFISLYESQVIHYVWNKIYSLDLIAKNNLRFDESVNLGEDFRFNILYMHYITTYQSISDFCYDYYINQSTSGLTTKYNKNSFIYFEYGFTMINRLCLLKKIDYPNLELRYINAVFDRAIQLNRSGLSKSDKSSLLSIDINKALSVIGSPNLSSIKTSLLIKFIMIKLLPSMAILKLYSIIKS